MITFKAGFFPLFFCFWFLSGCLFLFLHFWGFVPLLSGWAVSVLSFSMGNRAQAWNMLDPLPLLHRQPKLQFHDFRSLTPARSYCFTPALPQTLSSLEQRATGQFLVGINTCCKGSGAG